MARILIVDDEPSIVMAMRDELIFEGFEVDSASDGLSAIDKARQWQPDVLLLDLMLPGMNGLELCRQLRPEMPEMWIIMITVRDQEVDRVIGLELGADDYLTKPFSLRELVARVKVGLRRQRSHRQSQNRDVSSIHKFGNIEIDISAHRVLKKGKEVKLTRTEFDILRLLVHRAGEVISRDKFFDVIWEGVYVTNRTIDTHIATLRKKLEDDPSNPKHILSVRGVGYKLQI